MTKEEEIVGVLTGRLYEEQASKFDNGKRSMTDVMFLIGKSLTISADDVYRYLRKNGFPSGFLRDKPSMSDGFYCVKQPKGKFQGKYAIYGQERNCPYNVKITDDYEGALRYIVNEVTGN